MSIGLEHANTLPPYITAYRKGKSIDDLTLNHIMFLENEQQFPHNCTAAISDDIEKFFDRITTETQIVAMYQHGCPRQGYAEWVAETCYHSNATFVTKYVYITLPHLCGAKQGSSFACPSSNCVASFKSRAFFPPPKFSHPPLVRGYAFQFQSADARCSVQHLLITIQSYCDDDTRYTAALILPDLILQVQWSLDRSGDFSLITKLGRNIKSAQWISSITHQTSQPHPFTAPREAMIMRAHIHARSLQTPYQPHTSMMTPPISIPPPQS